MLKPPSALMGRSYPSLFHFVACAVHVANVGHVVPYSLSLKS
jgi:hypothetical protein